jgi:uncharacterized protein (TIGR03437 family)
LVGNQLGPLEETNAPLDRGSLPLELNGVTVRVGGVPTPLLSVQQGLITFFLPEDTPRGAANVEVWSRDGQVASTQVNVGGADFGILATDGSGRGQAAALNQDGSLNGPGNPAKWGSVVSIFGTGRLLLAAPLSVGHVNTTAPSREIVYEFAGPAPGLPPGVKQINFRLPNRDYPAGWMIVKPAGSPLFPPATIIFVSP